MGDRSTEVVLTIRKVKEGSILYGHQRKEMNHQYNKIFTCNYPIYNLYLEI